MQKSNMEELYSDICISLRILFTMSVSNASLSFLIKQIKIYNKIICVPRKSEYCAYTSLTAANRAGVRSEKEDGGCVCERLGVREGENGVWPPRPPCTVGSGRL